MRKTVITFCLLFMFFLLNGCGLQPRVIDGHYFNYGYEFSFEVPEGWEVVQKKPEWFYKIPDYIGRYQLMLANHRTKAIILFVSEKTILDMVWFSIYQEDFFEEYEKVIEGRKKIRDAAGVTNFNLSLNPIENFEKFCIFAEATGDIQHLKIKSYEIMYRCDQDDSCTLSMLLLSDKEYMDHNVTVLKKIAASLKLVRPEDIPKD